MTFSKILGKYDKLGLLCLQEEFIIFTTQVPRAKWIISFVWNGG